MKPGFFDPGALIVNESGECFSQDGAVQVPHHFPPPLLATATINSMTIAIPFDAQFKVLTGEPVDKIARLKDFHLENA